MSKKSKKESVEVKITEIRKRLTKANLRNLYRERENLWESTRQRFSLLFSVPIYVQDPLVAEYDAAIGVQDVEVSWEPGLSDGPTNARLAVVDYNADTDLLIPPAQWSDDEWKFVDSEGNPLLEAKVDSFQFHQVNAWATVQRVLDYYENPRALGRPIPWGFQGNRLIIVPHAGYGENAFYDRKTKSLQFYYFGPRAEPRYTCLSHDIVAHETGHAILDGIRPYYLELSSLETAAFHEFVGDLTALLMALDNKDMRKYMGSIAVGEGGEVDFTNPLEFVGRIADEFGRHVKNRKFLRSASEKVTMRDIAGNINPHHCSKVLTSAMFRILSRIAYTYTERNIKLREEGEKEVSPFQALYWSYNRFRRIALQPLDLCPPADIRFIDYARAVLHNDRLTNPADEKGYRGIMLEVFHEWGLCQRTDEEHESGICDLEFKHDLHGRRLLRGDIGSISRSRTSAYHFINDNREELNIPLNQDFFIADLYDTNKMDAAAVRQPREIVLQYLWREPVDLVGQEFGRFAGQTVHLLCGGTVVFDGRGNIISWFSKAGTQHDNDRAAGLKRRDELLGYISQRINGRQLALAEDDYGLAAMQSPAVAHFKDGELDIEISPHLRKVGDDLEEESWMTSL